LFLNEKKYCATALANILNATQNLTQLLKL
jgi:hypothetical protein